ncbi:SDR family oxidoreductase, partial [Acinetobacter baumannii]
DDLSAMHGAEVVPLHCDVGRESAVQAFVAEAKRRFNRIDIYCSNAGLVIDGDENTPDEVWTLNWNVHVMASVWAARAVVPQMLERGEGYF